MERNERHLTKTQTRKAADRPRKKRRRLSAFAYFLILLTVLLAGGAVGAICFLKVDTLTVSGKTAYTQEQILQASGLKTGGSVLFIDRKSASCRICESLPYIAAAEIRYIPFTGIQIRVKADAAAYEVRLKDGYAQINRNFKVLKISAQQESADKLPLINGVALGKPAAGHTLSANDRARVTQAAEILDGFKSNRVSGIVSVDVSDTYEIRANYDGRIDILIGTPADLGYKLRFAASLLKNKNDISDTDKGLLDVSQSAQSNRVSFIPS